MVLGFAKDMQRKNMGKVHVRVWHICDLADRSPVVSFRVDSGSRSLKLQKIRIDHAHGLQ